MPFFSVIVPAFNVEPYIHDCIDSLFKQTFSDFEIIAIDDGSSDGTLSILDKLAVLDSRLFVFSKENEGLSITRNYGIEKSSGKYIVYLDSDDTLQKYALEVIHDNLNAYDLDVLKFSAASFFNEKNNGQLSQKFYARPDNLLNKVMSGRDFFTQSALRKAFHSSACLIVVKRSLSIQIAFYPDIYFEDNIYTTQLLFHADCKRLMAIPDKLYCRRIRENSITTCYSQKHINDSLKVFFLLQDFFRSLQNLCFTEKIASHKVMIRLLYQAFSYLYNIDNIIYFKKRIFYSFLAIRYCYLAGLPCLSFLLLVNAPSLFYWLKRQTS